MDIVINHLYRFWPKYRTTTRPQQCPVILLIGAFFRGYFTPTIFITGLQMNVDIDMTSCWRHVKRTRKASQLICKLIWIKVILSFRRQKRSSKVCLITWLRCHGDKMGFLGMNKTHQLKNKILTSAGSHVQTTEDLFISDRNQQFTANFTAWWAFKARQVTLKTPMFVIRINAMKETVDKRSSTTTDNEPLKSHVTCSQFSLNPKQLAMLTEMGIDYDKPVSPMTLNPVNQLLFPWQPVFYPCL